MLIAVSWMCVLFITFDVATSYVSEYKIVRKGA